MTTIATDGIIIAADTQSVRGHNEIAPWRQEKIVRRHGRVYASSGSANIRDALIEWHNAGCNPKEIPVCSKEAGGWTLLVIDTTGMHICNEDTPYPMTVTPPFTMGSGGDWAMGAMHAGSSPERAVEIACQLDVYSGTPVRAINIAEALGLQRLEAVA
jgi:hypothetical protein